MNFLFSMWQQFYTVTKQENQMQIWKIYLQCWSYTLYKVKPVLRGHLLDKEKWPYKAGDPLKEVQVISNFLSWRGIWRENSQYISSLGEITQKLTFEFVDVEMVIFVLEILMKLISLQVSPCLKQINRNVIYFSNIIHFT
jgi:hypothetical protein